MFGGGKKLPKGWKEARDGFGRAYWYNKTSGETSFSRPTSERDSVRDDSLRLEIGLPMNVRHEGHIGQEDGAFKMSFTPEMASCRGTERMVDVVRQEASMRVSSRRDEPPPPPTRPLSLALPQNWAEFTDESTGRQFYHNASTGETMWEPPGQPRPSSMGASAQGPAVLPPGWKELGDEMGERYYYNTAT
eukprot:CAMPEP_0119341736 /NCGR_PEP_ID=MMETSP1333-20130426/103124_1 /TAXON_ID=418940 /ORGANISM="Scyphosphaera apsteinii, Strain RCC1455" /LENGTH=189 /DNA_ID=CAMNT_0007353787 /DNA_START=44 /DNA_END=609 /DNA_ORIENTATION=-